MTLYLVGKSALRVNASVLGGTFNFTIAAAQTANLPEGVMNWTLRAINSGTGEIYTVQAGVLAVRPDVSQQQSNQLPEEKMLGYIQAQMQNRLSGDAAIDALSIDNRMLRLMTMKELRQMEAEYMERLYAIRHRGTAGRLKFTNISVGKL
jgi:hypothetical protein